MSAVDIELMYFIIYQFILGLISMSLTNEIISEYFWVFITSEGRNIFKAI